MGFPKYVYKQGTGKQVNDAGLFSAESALVNSAEEFAQLPGVWVSSPVDAAPKKAEAAPEAKAEEKPAKKVK
jgi:hypothetical protein